MILIAFLTISQLRHWLWSSTAYGLKTNPITQHGGFHIRVPARLHPPLHCCLHGLYTLGKFPFVFLTPLLCSCYYISVRPFLVLTLTAYILPSPGGCLHATPFQQLPNLNPWQNEGSRILQSLASTTQAWNVYSFHDVWKYMIQVCTHAGYTTLSIWVRRQEEHKVFISNRGQTIIKAIK